MLLYNTIKSNVSTANKVFHWPVKLKTIQNFSHNNNFIYSVKSKQLKLSGSNNVQECKNQSHNKRREFELINGIGSDLKHRLRSSNEVCDVYRTAVDETAGVTSIAQPAVSV